MLLGASIVLSTLIAVCQAAEPTSSKITAGTIGMALKKKSLLWEKDTQGTKYRVRVNWDITFSDYVQESGSLCPQNSTCLD